jgi:FkbM family methyltransferase
VRTLEAPLQSARVPMPRLATRQKIAGARALQRPVLAARGLRSGGPVVRTRRGGVNWELDLREGIDFAIWLLGAFERSTLRAYRGEITEGDTVVDIGANVGAHTLRLAGLVGESGRVHAFEPSATAFAKLQRNLAANPEISARVTTSQAMLLADASAELPDAVVSSWPLLPYKELDETHPGIAQPTTGARATTLDLALEQLGAERVALVKLDVDGFECDVIDGAGATLERDRPVVLTELAPSVAALHGRTADELVDRFTAHGYALTTLRGAPVGPADVERLLATKSSMNVFARPPA